MNTERILSKYVVPAPFNQFAPIIDTYRITNHNIIGTFKTIEKHILHVSYRMLKNNIIIILKIIFFFHMARFW